MKAHLSGGRREDAQVCRCVWAPLPGTHPNPTLRRGRSQLWASRGTAGQRLPCLLGDPGEASPTRGRASGLRHHPRVPISPPSLPPAFVTPADVKGADPGPLQSPPGNDPSGALGGHRSARSLGYSCRTTVQRGRGPCPPPPQASGGDGREVTSWGGSALTAASSGRGRGGAGEGQAALPAKAAEGTRRFPGQTRGWDLCSSIEPAIHQVGAGAGDASPPRPPAGAGLRGIAIRDEAAAASAARLPTSAPCVHRRARPRQAGSLRGKEGAPLRSHLWASGGPAPREAVGAGGGDARTCGPRLRGPTPWRGRWQPRRAEQRSAEACAR